ncbi:unnamed protein product [Sphagnum jensenii]
MVMVVDSKFAATKFGSLPAVDICILHTIQFAQWRQLWFQSQHLFLRLQHGPALREYDGVVVDFSRQRATHETLDKLLVLAKEARLKEKIEVMFNGEHINTTEDRSVLHVALRAPQHEQIYCDGKNVVPDVWGVLDKIKDFTDRL